MLLDFAAGSIALPGKLPGTSCPASIRTEPFTITVVESHVKLPIYNTLKVQAGMDNGHYSVELFGNNLTNARGITQYSNNGGANQTGLAAIIQPRTIGIELGAKF